MPKFGLLLFAVLLSTVARATEWKVTRARDRDYVSFENLAEFYRFTEYSHANRTISLRCPQRAIRAQSDMSELSINGVRFFTNFPLLENSAGALISAFDVGKLIEPVLRPSRIVNAEPVKTIILDPGHGGTDNGTANQWGSEKTYALEVALIARDKLRAAGFTVEMTRDKDSGISLEDRVAFANRFSDAVFVSIHFNSGSGGTGVESYALAPKGAPSNAGGSGEHHATETGGVADEGNAQDCQNIALTAAVHAAVLSQAGVYDRGVRHARFKVLRHLHIPGLLLEAGFLNDPVEGRRIATPQYRQQLGLAIAQGVQSYNTAVNYRSPTPGATATFAVVRNVLPAHARSITEPLGAPSPSAQRAPEEPSLSINGGE
ncbi:MAG: N-acetylmuramoyl-L-alanine amidase [Chthoniobacterales bacterium]